MKSVATRLVVIARLFYGVCQVGRVEATTNVPTPPNSATQYLSSRRQSNALSIPSLCASVCEDDHPVPTRSISTSLLPFNTTPSGPKSYCESVASHQPSMSTGPSGRKSPYMLSSTVTSSCSTSDFFFNFAAYLRRAAIIFSWCPLGM